MKSVGVLAVIERNQPHGAKVDFAAFRLVRRRGKQTGRKHDHNRHQTNTTSRDIPPILQLDSARTRAM